MRIPEIAARRVLLWGGPALLVILFAGCTAGADESAPAIVSSRTPLDSLAWLAGYWVGEEDGTRMEEVWLPPAGGVMLGVHRDVFPSGRSFFEFLRIEAQDEGLVLLASPRGREPTPFVATEVGDLRVWFENPNHDYPQRIGYRLSGDSLHAEISGTDSDGAERSSKWVWRRATLRVK